MASVTCSLVDQIAIDIEKSKDTEGYGTVDLWSLMQRFALDIIGETAFGQTFDMIKNNSHFVPGAIKKELKVKVFSALFPFLTRVFLPASRKSHPYIHSVKYINLLSVGTILTLSHKFVEDIIAKRVNNKDNTRKDILQAFIDSQNEPDAQDRLSDEAIIAEVGLLLSAGSETTGSTLGFIIIELLKNPDKLKKLYQEIDEIPLEKEQKVHRHNQLKNLPYLNAVIHESLRLYSAIAIGFPRITDKELILNDQLTVPEGVCIDTYISFLKVYIRVS
jgi:cytochrome P450